MGSGLSCSSSGNGDFLVNSFCVKVLSAPSGRPYSLVFPVVRCRRQGQEVEIWSEKLPFISYGSKKARNSTGLTYRVISRR